jgi:hypothetical protein
MAARPEVSRALVWPGGAAGGARRVWLARRLLPAAAAPATAACTPAAAATASARSPPDRGVPGRAAPARYPQRPRVRPAWLTTSNAA